MPLLATPAYASVSPSIQEENQEHKNKAQPILSSASPGNRSRKKCKNQTKQNKKTPSKQNKRRGQLHKDERVPERMASGLSACASSPSGQGCLPPLSSPPLAHRPCASSSLSWSFHAAGVQAAAQSAGSPPCPSPGSEAWGLVWGQELLERLVRSSSHCCRTAHSAWLTQLSWSFSMQGGIGRSMAL